MKRRPNPPLLVAPRASCRKCTSLAVAHLWFVPCSNGMLFVESSAKTAEGVARIFEAVAEKLLSPQLPPSSTPASDSESEPGQS
jgi:hypothetical protein